MATDLSDGTDPVQPAPSPPRRRRRRVRVLRRLLRAFLFAGGLIVATLLLAIAATQTDAFRDWLRRYIIRQANGALNGELRIGAMRGNLFFGIELADVALLQGGERVVAFDRVRATYSVFDFIARRIVIEEVVLGRPVILARQTPDGWNLARLARPRQGGGGARPGITIGTIRLYDGEVVVERQGRDAPTTVRDLDLLIGVDIAREGFSIDLRHASLDLDNPALTVGRAVGRFTRRADVLTIDDARVDLSETNVTVDGAIRGLGREATADLSVTSGAFDFAEVGRLLPAISRIPLRPSFEARVTGPFAQLGTAIDLRSRAGDARGEVTIDLEGADRGVGGVMDLTRVDPAPWSWTPAVAGSVTGRARFDIRFPDRSRGLPTRGTFHVTGPAARVAGYEAQQYAVRGSFSGSQVRLDETTARAYGAQVSAAGTIEPVPGPEPGVLYALRGRARGVDLRRLPATLPIPDLDSSISTEYDVKGRGRRFEAAVTLDDSIIEGATFRAGTTGHILIDGEQLQYGGTGRVEGLALPAFGEALELDALTDPRLAGDLNGLFRVEASGRGARELELTADLDLEASTIAGAALPAMRIESRIAAGALTARLDGRFQQLDPGFVLKRPDFTGSLTGRLDGTLTFADLLQPLDFAGLGFSGDLALGPSTIRDHPIAWMHAALELANRRADVRNLEVSSPAFLLAASGTMAFDEDGASDLNYIVTRARLAEFRDLLGPVSGSVETSGRLTGNQAALTAVGSAHIQDLAIGTPVTAERAVADYTLVIPDLDVRSAGIQARTELSRLTVAGTPVDRLSGQVGFRERLVTFDAQATQSTRHLQANGRVRLEDGRQRIELDGLSISGGGVPWSLAAGTQPVVVVQDTAVSVERLALESGAQRIDIRGRLATDAGATSALEIDAREVRLEDVQRILGRDATPFQGVLSADARVTGSREAPRIDAAFAVTGGAFREMQFDRIAGTVGSDGRSIGLDVTVEQRPGATLTAGGTVPLALFQREAARQNGGNAPIDLRLRSSVIGLEVVTGLTTAVTNVTGQFSIDLHVTGTADNPLFDGGVDLQDAALTVPATGRRYTDLRTEFRFEPGRLRVDSLRVLDEDGDPLEITGQMFLNRLALGDVALRAVAQRFGLLRNEYGTIEMDFDLQITGAITQPHVVGEATIESGRVEVDRLLTRLTGGPYATDPIEDRIPVPGIGQRPVEPEPVEIRKGATAPAAAPPDAGAQRAREQQKPDGRREEPLLQGWVIDVRVRVPDNLILRGRDLRTSATSLGLGDINMTVGGDFRLRKEARTPMAVIGSVNTVRGSYDFRGRRFEILPDGRIQFQGTQPIDPTLDVTAQRVIEPSGVEARIRIQGTAREPTISFSSTPPLDESEILALIVFNQDLNSLGTDERTSIATLAGTTAAGYVVSPLTETLGRALNLDEFEVQATSEGGVAGGIVTIGEQVGERLFVRFRQQFGAQEVSEFLAEYRLESFLRLQLSLAEGEGVGRANRSLTRRIERAGVDLMFYYSY